MSETQVAVNKRSKPRTSDERFIEVWEKSQSVEDVATTLNMTVNNCYTRANKLRVLLAGTGQTLKTHGRAPKDAQALADLVAKFKS